MSKNIDELRKEDNKVKVKVISSEPVRTEKDGIVYLAKPQKVNYIDFMKEHPGCDALTDLKQNLGNASTLYVVAYAKSPECNILLGKMKENNQDKYGYFASLDLEENTI